jgi:hypothetical protein
VASWLWSRRKAYSGRQEMSTCSPCRNSRRRPVFCSKTWISWRPEYAFLLDHNQDATAGVDKEDAES